jgi:prophage regulatory protein
MFNKAQRGSNMLKTILRLPSVKSESGLSRSTLYLRIAQGLWTKPISLGGRSVGWPASEISTLNTARIAGKSDAEIRALVQTLEADRKKAM